ncbi:MAG: biopolymer transporter ExbD [Phycisphaerae bacterium]
MNIGPLQDDEMNRIFSGHKSSFNLRMAPMIDMIFLLLIFFLVTAGFQPPESFLPLNLAAAHSRNSIIRFEPLIISISAQESGCSVQIGQCSGVSVSENIIEIDLAVLAERISDCLKAQKRLLSDPIEIICEDDVKWDYVVKIYNLLWGVGLSDITFQITE